MPCATETKHQCMPFITIGKQNMILHCLIGKCNKTTLRCQQVVGSGYTNKTYCVALTYEKIINSWTSKEAEIDDDENTVTDDDQTTVMRNAEVVLNLEHLMIYFEHLSETTPSYFIRKQMCECVAHKQYAKLPQQKIMTFLSYKTAIMIFCKYDNQSS